MSLVSDFKYLRVLEAKGIRPNFWVSDEYFEKAGFKESLAYAIDSPSICIEDSEGQMILPPLDLRLNETWGHIPKGKNSVWCGLDGYAPLGGKQDFLDLEYIYDSKAFLNMTGKRWATFRKNCRKYPNRHEGELRYKAVDPIKDVEKVNEFLGLWSKEIEWDEVHDGIIMVEYGLLGQNREVLMDLAGDIHGLNIWDENYMFINYRFCLCLDQPFLSEYMRHLFYVHRAEQDKLVNDGGILGKPELKRFKDKLNPVEVNKIYSWRF